MCHAISAPFTRDLSRVWALKPGADVEGSCALHPTAALFFISLLSIHHSARCHAPAQQRAGFPIRYRLVSNMSSRCAIFMSSSAN
jgi:hypothetical protein